MVKKRKESKTLPQKQKSRAKYQCPSELSELIRQANLVPIGVITPDYEYEVRKEIQRLTKENDGEPPKFSEYEFLINLIKHLPKEFSEHIENLAASRTLFGEGFPDEDWRFRGEFIRQYVEYCSMRDSMFWLVQRIETEYQRMWDVEKSRHLKEGSLTFEHFHLLNWDSNPISIKTVLKRNDSGELYITGLAALIGKFDDSRLRRCVICHSTFWAKRKDSKTCSPSCLNILNVRNSRALTDEEKAERKAQREANRNLVKDGKAKRSKN